MDNSDNMVKILSLFVKNINKFKNAIRRGDSTKLLNIFKLTKTVREDIIKAGQDTDKPDFGRKKFKLIFLTPYRFCFPILP